MKYENFTGPDDNMIWTWVIEDGEYQFKQVRLKHAIAGDTDSIMMRFPASLEFEDHQELVDISDGIGEMVNDSFADWAMHAFNAPADRVIELQTEREIVSDVSLFLSKKRYILHVVNDEGKWVDKLKIMGVEIKKSDTPEYVKVMLEDLVKMILNGNTNKELTDRIKYHKEEYKNQPLADIARPMSVKGLKKYTDMYEATGSEKGFPYNVRAALFYNSLCGPTDKQIVPGDKIGIVYIKHPRSKYIAFPIDTNTLPSFVTDLTVDYETQWSKAYKKVVSYMSAMGWDFKSKKEANRKKLFGF